jgi:hypothetical protein
LVSAFSVWLRCAALVAAIAAAMAGTARGVTTAATESTVAGGCTGRCTPRRTHDASPAERRSRGYSERARAKRNLEEGRTRARMRGPVLDDAALGAVLGRVDAATGEARAAILDGLRAIHGVLDDGQRAQVASMLDSSGGWWRSGPYR